MAKSKTVRREKKPRVRKQPQYKSFRLSKKIKPSAKKPLPGIIRLCKIALRPLKQDKKLFFGIMAIYFLLVVVFVSGIGSLTSFVQVKQNLEQALGGNINNISSGLVLFSYALGSGAGSGSTTNYQTFIFLIISLVFIWSIRQVLAGERIGVKQAFYQGIYPLVPFLLIMFVIGLQIIPLIIGGFILATVVGNGLAVNGLEQSIFWIIFILLALLSFYMILSSLFALYISTLPDMTPMKALRSARSLVLHRRLPITLRLLGLPIALTLLYALILLPLIFIIPVLVVPVFLLLNSFGLFFIHSYLYNLYRCLL
ncbi:MAG TPA: hypothetical protein VFW77_00070 [Candidatus Saccharimonadales bacterium]|nr:hypothetical protein [Candidatus Saccharimonadales bacterium]